MLFRSAGRVPCRETEREYLICNQFMFTVMFLFALDGLVVIDTFHLVTVCLPGVYSITYRCMRQFVNLPVCPAISTDSLVFQSLGNL